MFFHSFAYLITQALRQVTKIKRLPLVGEEDTGTVDEDAFAGIPEKSQHGSKCFINIILILLFLRSEPSDQKNHLAHFIRQRDTRSHLDSTKMGEVSVSQMRGWQGRHCYLLCTDSIPDTVPGKGRTFDLSQSQ